VPVEILALAGVGDQALDPFEIEVLRDVVVGAVAHRLDRRVELADHGDDDHLDVGIVLARDLQHFEAADAGKAHVEQQKVDVFLLHDLQGELARGRAQHAVVAPQHRHERVAHSLIVVDDEQRLAAVGHPRWRVY
jgi:hypothetical protein